jgi:hypothetical protein
VTSFGLFIFENYVNVHSKSNKQKNFIKKLVFCWPLEGPNPDPLVRGMDTRIRIWIRTHQKVMDPEHWSEVKYLD